ncbi:MAG: putative permease [Myxococcales bacterium]|nr:putative permease [Myxococcales bacterium]
MDLAQLALVAVVALAAGVVNAIAGGGSLLSFPVLLAVGLPAVTASLTNTVAMCPGYLGATLAQRRDLVGQGRRVVGVLPAGAIGGVAGALLLLTTGERAFDVTVPFLLLFAAALLGMQDRLRKLFVGGTPGAPRSETWAIVPVALAAVYGGYFGAGLGVIVLAALAVVLDDSLIRINALKQSVSLVVNVSAALIFVFAGRVDWSVALVMAFASLAGGALGGAIASRVSASLLRWSVIVVGVGVSVVYFVKLLR